jgi:OOP family OmpA-OmpF porin
MKINFRGRVIISWIMFLVVSGCHHGKPAKTVAVEGGSAQDKDTDGDYIPDSRDKCPAEKENYNGYADEDGCPDSVDPFPIEKIEISARIFFKQGESTIQEMSYQVLDGIVELLMSVPMIKHVRIVGHIDPSEKEEIGADLSLERAKNVMDYLISKGIDKARLEAAGMGDAEPAADAEDKEGEEKAPYNRRVEFEITEFDK